MSLGCREEVKEKEKGEVLKTWTLEKKARRGG